MIPGKFVKEKELPELAFPPSAHCLDPLKMGGWVENDRKTKKHPKYKKPDKEEYVSFLWQLHTNSSNTFIPHDEYDRAVYCEAQGIDEKLKKEVYGKSKEEYQKLKSSIYLPPKLEEWVFGSKEEEKQIKKRELSESPSPHPSFLFQSEFRTFGNVWHGGWGGFNPKAHSMYNPSLERSLEQFRWIRWRIGKNLNKVFYFFESNPILTKA